MSKREREALLDYARWWRGEKNGQPTIWWHQMPFVYFDPRLVHGPFNYFDRDRVCESLAYDGTDGP